jgi:hypothetical protein
MLTTTQKQTRQALRVSAAAKLRKALAAAEQPLQILLDALEDVDADRLGTFDKTPHRNPAWSAAGRIREVKEDVEHLIERLGNPEAEQS